ncbi:ATP-binding protein [bacterium]|nr:ATP-binding protein [bacterium]
MVLALSVFIIPLLDPTYAFGHRTARFEHVTVDQGLSENAITAIFQDRQGFLWIGTHDGLNRYDGYNFRTFRRDPKDSTSISDNIVTSAVHGHNGTIWFGTLMAGLNLYDPDTEKFTRYKHDPNESGSINSDTIRALFSDGDGLIWIGTDNGLDSYDPVSETFTHYQYVFPDGSTLDSKRVFHLAENRAGLLMMSLGESGLLSYNKEAQTFSQIRVISDQLATKTALTAFFFREDKRGLNWVTTGFGVDVFDTNYVLKEHLEIVDPQSSELNIAGFTYEDEQGLVWIGRADGLGLYDPIEHVHELFRYDPYNPHSFSNTYCTTYCVDRTGLLWVGTEGGGLNKYNPRKATLAHYFHKPTDETSLSNNFVMALYIDSEDTLWVGTIGSGLNRFDPNSGDFDHFVHDPGDPSSIGSNLVRAIVEDRWHNIWVGTYGGGISILNRDNQTFSHYQYDPLDPASIGSDRITAFYRDRSGTIWGGTETGGLNRYDEKTGSFHRFMHDPENPDSISSSSAMDIIEDHQGVLWIATGGNGLDRFDRDRGCFSHYRHDPENPASLSDNRAWSLYEDSSGTLWIGTYGGGFNRFRPESHDFVRYGVKEGLANNVVYGFLEDKQGHLWMSTNHGISRFNPRTGRFKNYNKSDGLQSNEFNTGALCQDRNGRMYFGGVNGFNAFYPEQVIENPYAPPLVLTSFKVFDQELKADKAVNRLNRVELSHDQNFFSFEFAALDFSTPNKNQYAYKLEGVNSDWVACGTRRFGSYTNIDPGLYKLKIKGSNDDGVWNEVGLTLDIIIRPPFWQTWWFFALEMSAILLIMSTIIFFITRYILLLKAKAQAEQFAMVGKFASYFAHDLKSPLEGAFLIASELKDTIDPDDQKRKFYEDLVQGISRVRALVMNALDFAKASKPRPMPTDLNGLIRTKADDFQQTCPCQFSFELDPTLPHLMIDAQLFQRIFDNLFRNSYQARQETCHITIRTRSERQWAMITVSDTGKGIKQDMIDHVFEPFSSDTGKGYGFGLAFCFETIKSHGGSITVSSSTGQGATFTIKLPHQAGLS